MYNFCLLVSTLHPQPRDFGTMLVRVVHNDSGMIENFARLRSHDTMDIDVQLRELWTATISEATTIRTLSLVSVMIIETFFFSPFLYMSHLICFSLYFPCCSMSQLMLSTNAYNTDQMLFLWFYHLEILMFGI